MGPTVRRRPKSKSSVIYCGEKLCCTNVNSEAKFFCEDCNSAQCQECEKDIHYKYGFHDRAELPVIPESQLCESKRINLICQERNFPDLWCENCKLALCFKCFDKFHNTEKKRQHINVTINYHLKKLSEEQNKELSIELYDSSEFYQDAQTDMIKPLAPYSLADDSLTFCSFPQESGEIYKDMAFTSSNLNYSTNDHTSSIVGGDQVGEVSGTLEKASLEDSICDQLYPSFILIDDQEILQVKDAEVFKDKLGCGYNDTYKVISIFGNTGDGKSHTLNHTFFKGHEMFATSTTPTSCTLGVWCALDKENRTIIMDTEGLLGSSSNENQRTRLLLKILAVSDVVIYRTRAERLHTDMFVFLSNASVSYCQHFSQVLKSTSQRFGIPESNLGPTLIVFHETTHTDVIKDTKEKSAPGVLRDMFINHGNAIDAFRNLCYVGVKTTKPPTNFHPLRKCIYTQLKDNTIRTPRKPEIIFNALKTVNDKYSEDIETPPLNTFPDQYFTCTSRCLACNVRCTFSMNHNLDEEPHDCGPGNLCRYQTQFGNKVFMCKHCLRNKEKVVVVPKTSSSSDSAWLGLTRYLWSGYVYECRNCGIIYRSREHWYGNEEEEKVLHVEFKHMWPQGHSSLEGTHNAARKVIDSLHYVADTISSVGLKPTKYLAEWTADQINPSYWVPNSDITKCSVCELLFTCNEQKHHCRACGKGVCCDCSTKSRPVPEKGWGPNPVRVCDKCFSESENGATDETYTARIVGEAMTSTFSAVASVLDYPMGMIKNSAKPVYWVPDDQIESCCVCAKRFGPRLSIHHCRACGQGVCDECSPSKRIVAFRGWDYPVRVCNKCEKKTDRI